MKLSTLFFLAVSSAFSTAVAADEKSSPNVGKIHIDFKIFKAAYTRNNGGKVTTVTTTVTQPVTVTVAPSAAPTRGPVTTAAPISSIQLPTVGDVTSVTGTKGETVVATIIEEVLTSTATPTTALPQTTAITNSTTTFETSIELITNVVTRTPSWIPVRPTWTWKKPSNSSKTTSPASSAAPPVEISSVSSSVPSTSVASSGPSTTYISSRSISWEPVRPSWTWKKPTTKITGTGPITTPTPTKPAFTPSTSIKWGNSTSIKTRSSRPPWTWTKPKTSNSVILTTAPFSSDTKTQTTQHITRTTKDTTRRPPTWPTKSPKPSLSTGFSSGTAVILTSVSSSSVKWGNSTVSIVKPTTKTSRPPWTWVKPSTTAIGTGVSSIPIPKPTTTTKKSTRPPWTWTKPTTKPISTGFSTGIFSSGTGKPTSIPLSSVKYPNSTATLIPTTRSKSTRSTRPPWTWTKPTTKPTSRPLSTGTGISSSVSSTTVKWGNSTVSIRTPTAPSSRPPWTWTKPGTSVKPTGTGIIPIPTTSLSSKWSNSTRTRTRPSFTWPKPSSTTKLPGTGTGVVPTPVVSSSSKWSNSTRTRTRPSFTRPSFTRTRSSGTGIPTAIPSSTKSGNYVTTTTTLTVQLPDQTVTVTLSSTTTLVTKTTVVTLPPGATITHFTTRHFTVPESGDSTSAVGTSKEIISALLGAPTDSAIRTLTSVATLSVPGAVVTRVVPGTETVVTATASLIPRAEESLVDGVRVVTMTKTVSAANGQEVKCTGNPRASGKEFLWPGLVEWIKNGGKKDKE